MRLKRVKIFGFKTFADRIEVNLDGGIIAVVGPNGCGKSNLVDAILWGLGEGNARQLRAAHSQDVIFNGSARRKPVGFAEVQLLFDNEDGSLPIDSPEVSLSRKLNRAGDSEYAINRQNCRQRDVYDLLADSGLGRSGYAIVGQKEIDSALSASADERRGWVDEAAGVQRYRTRKQESQRRLTAALQHLERIDDILHELSTQREPLREEAEVAARYKTMLSSLREVESALLIHEVAKAVAEVREMEARIEQSIKLSRQEAERAEKIDAELKRTGEAISALESEMDSVRGLQQGSLTAVERADADLRLAGQRLASLDDLEKSLSEEQGTAKERLEDAQRDLESLRKEELNDRDALDLLQKECAGADTEAKALAAKLKQLEKELSEAREAHNTRIKQQAQTAARLDRKKLAQRELEGIQNTLPDLIKAVEEAEAAHQGPAEAVKLAQIAIKEIEQRLQNARQEEERDAQQTRKLMAERASLEGRRRGIEATIETHEGLNQGTRAVLEARERGLLQGSYTPVAEAIDVDKDLALAIETALGGSSNDLIVPHESDAKEAIAWLKQNRLGRATFQPIPLMRPFEPSFELRKLLNEKGIVGRASELVDCDPHHRPVIDSLLGRVLIVEDLDLGLRLAKTQGWSRMVTLEGEVLHSSGAVTGGVQAKQSYGIVQRKADLNETEREIESLDKLIREAEARSESRRKASAQIQNQMLEHRDTINDREDEVAEALQFLQTLKAEVHDAERAKTRLQNELDNLSREEGLVAPEINLALIESQRDETLKQLAARTSDAEQSTSRLKEAELRLQQAQLRLYQGERRLQAATEADSSREKKMLHLEPERDKLRHEMTQIEKAREKAREEKQEADQRIDKAQEAKRAHLEKSLQLSEEAKDARANASTVGEAAHQAELTRARADAKRTAALQRLFEDYGLNEEEALDQEGTREIPSDAAAIVYRLRRDLKAMGDVNVGAIEAFQKLTERHDDLSAQREDVVGGIDQVNASIAELDKMTRERFITTFSAVQEAFTETYQKLFNGGEGRISLSNEQDVLESGIELHVTLPGKKQQPLQLLSGGERALCATAFLFALLKVKPSPLVILDEVDAPMDGRNVERFAALLHEYTDKIQFIVITHNPTTIEQAPVWLGVTMQEPGVSTFIPARLPETKARIEQESALEIGYAPNA